MDIVNSMSNGVVIRDLQMYVDGMRSEIPEDVYNAVKFMIDVYMVYCRPIFMNVNSAFDVATILKTRSVNNGSFELVRNTIHDPLVMQIYDILTDNVDMNVESAVVEALGFNRFAAALEKTRWHQQLYFAAARMFDYVRISKANVTYVINDDEVDVQECDAGITIDDVYYALPDVIDVDDGHSSVSASSDIVCSYIEDQFDMLCDEDTEVAVGKVSTAVGFLSNIRTVYSDYYHNLNDSRGLLSTDAYDMNYKIRAFYNLVRSTGVKSVVLEGYDSVVYNFVEAAFISYNKSLGLSVHDAPVLYASDVYRTDEIIKGAEMVCVNFFSFFGSPHEVSFEDCLDANKKSQFNEQWYETEIQKYYGDERYSSVTFIVLGFNRFPVHFSKFNGCIGVPGFLSSDCYWYPVNPYNLSGFVLFHKGSHSSGHQMPQYSVAVFGRYNTKFKSWLINVFTANIFRNSKIFPTDGRLSSHKDKVKSKYYELNSNYPLYHEFWFDGAYLFFDPDKYVIVKNASNDEAFRDYDIIRLLVELRVKAVDGMIKQNVFLYSTGFSQQKLDQLIYMGKLRCVTVKGEKFLRSAYWIDHDVIGGNGECESIFPKRFDEVLSSVMICSDGMIFGDIEVPTQSVVELKESYNDVINVCAGRRGVASILSIFKGVT
jgi:hypothetical protein